MNQRQIIVYTANDFLKEKDINIRIKEVANNNNGFARYEPGHDFIEINVPALIFYSDGTTQHVKDLLLLNLCHEIGHALDEYMLNDLKEMSTIYGRITEDGLRQDEFKKLLSLRYNLEQRATDTGRKYIPDELLEEYDSFYHHYLSVVKDIECSFIERQQLRWNKRLLTK